MPAKPLAIASRKARTRGQDEPREAASAEMGECSAWGAARVQLGQPQTCISPGPAAWGPAAELEGVELGGGSPCSCEEAELPSFGGWMLKAAGAADSRRDGLVLCLAPGAVGDAREEPRSYRSRRCWAGSTPGCHAAAPRDHRGARAAPRQALILLRKDQLCPGTLPSCTHPRGPGPPEAPQLRGRV